MPTDLPRLIGINHVALEVGDIDEALAFYGKIFRCTLRGAATLRSHALAPGFLCAQSRLRTFAPAA